MSKIHKGLDHVRYEALEGREHIGHKTPRAQKHVRYEAREAREHVEHEARRARKHAWKVI